MLSMSNTLFAKGLNWMPRDLEVSPVFIANMVPFVNLSDYFIMTLRVEHWNNLDDSLAF